MRIFTAPLILLISLLGFVCMRSAAQNAPAKIVGMVQDEQRKGIEGATITLLALKDSSPVKSVLAGRQGAFELRDLSAGDYRVRVTAAGYAASYSPQVRVDMAGAFVRLDAISLHPANALLGEVTVTGKRPLMEQKIDRMIINVDAAVTNTGATVMEVLEKSPGVMVDKDGNISLKGKSGVLVMLDGKPTYLSGDDLSNLLSSMNANQVDQIEIMTNPPAKYDAAGNAGIINIKTKKNKARGFNGSITGGYGQGKYWKTSNSLNLNYRTQAFNLFFNYSFNAWRGYSTLDIQNNYLSTDAKTVISQLVESTYLKRYVPSNNAKLGMDYFLGARTTLGFVTTGFLNYRQLNGVSIANVGDASGHVDSSARTTTRDYTRWLNGAVNLNLRHSFDSTHELSADADYIHYSATDPQLFITTSYYPDGTVTGIDSLKGALPFDIKIYSGKADYSQTLKKGIKWESGWKSSLVETDYGSYYYDTAGGGWQPDYGKTSHFLYRENVNALYSNLDYAEGPWALKAGLRYENTNYTGHQLGNPAKPDSLFSRHYNNLFPSLFLSYAVDKDNQFVLSGGRRIDRPPYRKLDPFLFIINEYTYQQGNPLMTPQYTTNIELSHVFRGILTTALTYSHTEGYFAQIFVAQGDTTLIKEGNLGTRESEGISVNAQLAPAPWWALTLHTDIEYLQFTGNTFGANVNMSGWDGQVNANNQFRFKRGWSAELSGFYNTGGLDGQNSMGPFGQLGMGASKQLMRGKATLRVSVQDIFHTNYEIANVHFENVRTHILYKSDTRVANIAFTYRFGKTVKETAKRSNGSGKEEQGRVTL